MDEVTKQKKLLAYVSFSGEAASFAAVTDAAVRQHLSASLPKYMVPAEIFVLIGEPLPRLANGKVDGKTLLTEKFRSAQKAWMQKTFAGRQNTVEGPLEGGAQNGKHCLII